MFCVCFFWCFFSPSLSAAYGRSLVLVTPPPPRAFLPGGGGNKQRTAPGAFARGLLNMVEKTNHEARVPLACSTPAVSRQRFCQPSIPSTHHFQYVALCLCVARTLRRP